MRHRQTKVKTLIETILQKHHQPLSLREVYDLVKRSYPSTAYSTVFRIIKNLHLQQHLVQVDWRQRGSYYEWAHHHHHHHIVCEQCGEVLDIRDQDIGFQPEKIAQQTGFLINYHSIEIKGTCTSCQ